MDNKTVLEKFDKFTGCIRSVDQVDCLTEMNNYLDEKYHKVGKVFISGSIAIRSLPAEAIQRIENIMAKNLEIVIGWHFSCNISARAMFLPEILHEL